MDLQNLASWLKKGSREPRIQIEVYNLFTQLTKLNVVTEPVLVPRDHAAIKFADFAGKDRNTDEKQAVEYHLLSLVIFMVQCS